MPVTVTVKVPAVDPEQDSVELELPPFERVTLVGLRLHDKPVGETDCVSVTGPWKPFLLVRVIDDVPVDPVFIETVAGFALIEKSGAAPTLNVTLVV